MSRRSDELKERYLRWLEPQIRDERDNPDRSYWDLVNVMFATPFGWLDSIPMDENRVGDGRDLRIEFGSTTRSGSISVDILEEWGPISFLEVLIGLSRRLAFVAGGQAPGWAWQLIRNIELDRMWDPLTRPKHRKALEVMDVVINRKYAPDGTGGFFPLAWNDDDQTKIELWYQLNSFVEELHPEH